MAANSRLQHHKSIYDHNSFRADCQLLQINIPMNALIRFLLTTMAVLPLVAADLRAGFARIDISPSPAQPVTMAGYAARANLSQGIHDSTLRPRDGSGIRRQTPRHHLCR